MKRYLNYSFKEGDVVVNIVRLNYTKTASLQESPGKAVVAFEGKYNLLDSFISTEENN